MVTETSTEIRITQPVLDQRGATRNGIEMTHWRRSAEQELRQIGLRWTQIEHQAQDRDQWKKTVDELCLT